MDRVIEYGPDSFAGPLPPGRIAEFERAFTNWVEADETVRLPQDYAAHIARFHGGVPRNKCFRDAKGRERVLGRLLNFFTRSDALPPPAVPSWRGGHGDIRLDYSVYTVGPMAEPYADTLGPHLVPFAGLDTNGHDCRAMAEFDALCFDFGQGPAPRIVTWSVRHSRPDSPSTEFVADTFTRLVGMLYPPPPGSAFAQDDIKHF